MNHVHLISHVLLGQAARWLHRILAVLILAAVLPVAAKPSDRLITGPWRAALTTTGGDGAYQAAGFRDDTWAQVTVPHNWQGYSYDRQVVKGTLHGTAWYRKAIDVPAHGPGERVFLMFEGVNAYATVYVNGRLIGRHAGGLTTFTLDATAALRANNNVLAVRVDNPDGIRDLPWVPGDDSPENGFSEGSQPFGIFRPVHVIVAASLRVQPFGVYAWGDESTITAASATLNVRSELENLSARDRAFTVVNEMVDAAGRVVASTSRAARLAAGAKVRVEGVLPAIAHPRLWSPADPYLYTLRARIVEDGKVVDEQSTPYGIRHVAIVKQDDGTRQLRINGQPFFIHGIAEYEHALGNSHAFSEAEIDARISQVQAGGFNAFRDAHYPHNLRYGQLLQQKGLMWWPQFSSHVWFDNPGFRANFLTLVADWVRERRNNPANFIWGLQNESVLPEEFVKEIMTVMRDADPTASKQRLIVTCNGGKGSDWNVPQNWSGTYGGDPQNYAVELQKQGLVGEYGAWRSLGLHQDTPAKGVFSESSMTAILETKARLGQSVSDKVVGDFVWLLGTHENPGRQMRADGLQIAEGIRPLERIGPVNNKGLMTLWGEPLDAYYMLRARTVPATRTPVVYIVSHTWPDRWTEPGVKSGIQVFSNCDEVELFNDVTGRLSLGRRKRAADGAPLVWNEVAIRYNALSATCYVGGAARARDVVVLNNLPAAPDLAARVAAPADITMGEPGATYLYRVNAGGPDVEDADGQLWSGDRHLTPGATWGWTSWADAYPDLDPAQASRRVHYDAIAGTTEQTLFSTYRYGRDGLSYTFSVPEGDYAIELYFTEPWYGRTGIDATGWRVFDVAVNGKTVLRDLDLFREAGFEHAVKKVVRARTVNGKLVIQFPRVAAGQALVSAIAVRTTARVAVPRDDGATDLIAGVRDVQARTFLDNGDDVQGRNAAAGGARWSQLPLDLLDCDWLPMVPGAAGSHRFTTRVDSDVYRALPAGGAVPDGWHASGLSARLIGAEGTTPVHFVTRRFAAGATVEAPAAWPVLVRRHLPLPYAPGDGKDVTLLEAEAARLDRAAPATDVKGYGGSGYVLTQPGGSVTWPAAYGISARHSFTLRYQGTAAGHLSVTDASGIVVADLPVSFTAGEPAAWQEVTVTTPSLINAGTYELKLTVDGAVNVDALKMR